MTDEAATPSRRDRARRNHLARPSGESIADLPETHRAAWISARSEFDRQLLGLSAAGVGILIPTSELLSPMSTLMSITFLACIGFLVCCCLTMLWLLRANADFIESDAAGTGADRARLATKLMRLDFLARVLFGLGIASGAFLGVLSVIG